MRMRIEYGRPRCRARSSTFMRVLYGRLWRMKRFSRISRRRKRINDDELWAESITIGTEVHGAFNMNVLHDLRKTCGGTCGSVLWAASTALAGWLCARPSRLDLFVGRTVLELGCGLGFIGTAMHKMGARDVLVTDLPRQLPLVRRNLAANADMDGHAAQGHLRCCGFAWGRRPRTVFRHAWDLVVGCDVVYDRDCVDPLVQSLQSLLLLTSGTNRCKVLLALPDRTEFGFHVRTAHGELLPKLDYELLIHRLQKQLSGQLRIEMLDTVSSKDAATTGSSIDVLLLSLCDDPADATPTFDAGYARARRCAEREAEQQRSSSTEGRGDSKLPHIYRDPAYTVVQN